ncbi:MAG TPA: hypothetical protein GX525_11350 [Bacilli bacterium]|nr:hypothetical protein [Bacilli bacterium]
MKKKLAIVFVLSIFIISLSINVISFIGERNFEESLFRHYKEEIINLDHFLEAFINSTSIEDKETNLKYMYRSVNRAWAIGDILSEKIPKERGNEVHVFIAIPYELMWILDEENLLAVDNEEQQQISSILKIYLSELMKLEPMNDENVRDSYHRIHIQIRGLNLNGNFVPRQIDI